MKETFLIISTLFALSTPFIGVRAILKGQYKPHRTTRLVFVIVTALMTLTLYFQGDRTAVYLAFVSFLLCTTIFILSFKYGVGGRSKTDFIVLFLAVLAIVLWQVSDNPTVGLYMSILADFIGFLPTIVKAYRMPHTEDWKFYASDVVAGFFSLLALNAYLFKDVIFASYILAINLLLMLIVILRTRVFQAKNLSSQ